MQVINPHEWLVKNRPTFTVKAERFKELIQYSELINLSSIYSKYRLQL